MDRGLFLAGLLLAPVLLRLAGASVDFGDRHPSIGLVAAAGLPVGFGTRLDSGCASGHGVCGLAALSPRSLAATLVFLAAAVVTVCLLRQLGAGLA